MPKLVPILAAIRLFPPGKETRESLRNALDHNGCLVPYGKICRVDVGKFRAAYPKIEVPAWWLEEEIVREEVLVRDLARLLPLKFVSGVIKTQAELKTMIFYGQWWKKQISYSRTVYDLQQFKDGGEWWVEAQEREFRLRGMLLAKKNGELASNIAKLCTRWEEALAEKRLGVRRATGQLTQSEFEAEYKALEEQVAKAPWDHRDVKALLKALHV